MPLGRPMTSGLQMAGRQFLAESLGYLGDVGLALGAARGQQPRDFPVLGLVQMAKSQVVQLPLEFPDAQAVGQRRIYVQRFLGDAPALGFGQGIQRAHVVEAVGELDEDDADVLGHGHQHFAEAFGIEVFRYGDAGPIGNRAGDNPHAPTW